MAYNITTNQTLNNNLWNEDIDEFINWVDGVSFIDKQNKTENLTPSGYAIRKLLQKKLQYPIYTSDLGDGYIRVFSSEEAYNYWIKSGKTLKDLVLLEFAKPSEYEVTFSILGDNSAVRYIANSESLAMNPDTELNLYWTIVKDSAVQPVPVRLDVTINNKSTGRTKSYSNPYSAEIHETTLKLAPDLGVGQNTVIIELVGNNGARGYVSIDINVVEFTLNVDFSYENYKMHEVDEPIKINGYTVSRNIKNSTVEIKCNINNVPIDLGVGHSFNENVDIIHAPFNITNNGLLPNSTNPDEDKVIHKMQMWAETTLGNTTFISNVLYWTFEIPIHSTLNIENYFLNVYTSTPSNYVVSTPIGEIKLYANQYLPFKLNYAYYTDAMFANQSITIYWYFRQGENETFIKQTTAQKGVKSILEFIPEISTDPKYPLYLVAKRYEIAKANFPEDWEELLSMEINITKGTGFTENTNYELKLNAYGRVNENTTESKQWKYNSINTEFTNISWDNINGWYNNSFRTCGTTSYAEIQYAPLFVAQGASASSLGKTIEIDFESERVNNPDSDVLILVGEKTGARIEIKPNSACLYDTTNQKIIETNYKANERVHLAFIINPVDQTSVNNGLVYIINNGIFERAAAGGGVDSFKSSGFITLGGSPSGVRVYSVRCYNFAMTYTAAYNNFLFDSPDKLTIYNNNDIRDKITQKISIDECKQKMDVILIEGNIRNLIDSSDKLSSQTDVNISRYSHDDPTKNFTCNGCMIRRHGQSTLNYPVPSMKFWFNKSLNGPTPEFTCESQKNLGLAKNRYIMKDGAIPSNKFVLQANYADSSGVHNGSLQRLINETWYKAKIDNEYKLRTIPQLFTSNEKISNDDVNLHEDLDPNRYLICGKNADGTVARQWKDYFGTKQFPYNMIQYGPDSFPCVVFYKDESEGGETTFLGQYVFMEDKKSDYLYGERSMYRDITNTVDLSDDPFVLKSTNNKGGANAISVPNNPDGKALDTDENRIWDNENVLRIEGVTINTNFSSFIGWTDQNVQFTDIVDELDENDEPTGNRIYRFERDFEMIYPDPDDVEGKVDSITGTDTTKFSTQTDELGNPKSKFLRKVMPFVKFYKWITDTRNNYNNNTDWWRAGQYSDADEAFQATAAQHLDLYKIAAYYIFCLRFGLVDSTERNLQYKTYDGIHWHFEPWDMDIALGNRNTGGIAFDPPIDRNTTFKGDSNSFAFSGRVKQNGLLTRSNWLWDALENWDYWIKTVVPKVSDALYRSGSGLSYENVNKMFDDNYQDQWCETVYNESCNYKYIIARNGNNKYLNWLQGARTTHRHWWLSKSMNYYDAKWNCGEYKKHDIYVQAGHNNPAGDPTYGIPADPNWDGSQQYIIIKPSSETFIAAEQQNQPIAGYVSGPYTPNNPARINITSMSFQDKVETHFFGATFFEEIDFSELARNAQTFKIDNCWDNTLGAPIKVLTIGCKISRTATGEQKGYISQGAEIIHIKSDDNGVQHSVLENLVKFNVEGLQGYTDASIIRTWNLKELTHFYGRGSGLTKFYSSSDGNNFKELILPALTKNTVGDNTLPQFAELNLHNTKWELLEFWDAYIDKETNYTTYTKTNASWGVRYNIPTSLKSVSFTGTTGKTYNSMRFVIDWIEVKRKWVTELINGGDRTLGVKTDDYDYSNCETIDDALRVELRQCTLVMDQIKWDQESFGDGRSLMTYEQLSYIAEFNNGKNKVIDGNESPLSGYIMLDEGNGQLTAQQLAQIKVWFGNNAFTKNSPGVVIDQILNYTRISVGDYATVELNPETGEDEIYLAEGSSATLTATKFSLSNEPRQATWYLQDPTNPNITGSTLNGCSLAYDNYFTYIVASETQGGIDHDVIVGVNVPGDPTAADEADREDYNADVLIHIRAVRYPEIELICDSAKYNRNGQMLRSFKSGVGANELITYTYWQDGLQAEFYPVFTGDGVTATLEGVTYTIIDNDTGATLLNHVDYNIFTTKNSAEATIPQSIGNEYCPLKYTKNTEHLYGMRMLVSGNITNDLKSYKLTVTVEYSSRKQIILNANIYVIQDDQVIVQATDTPLYRCLVAKYYEINQRNPSGGFYKTDLLSLSGKLSFNNPQYNTVSVLTTEYSDNETTTLDHTSVFEFLPNITEIDLTGCSGLTLRNFNMTEFRDPKYNLSFINCKKLKVLKLSDCSLLGKNDSGEVEYTTAQARNYTIDLTKCTEIEEVYAEGTYLNIKVPTKSNLRIFHLGHPKDIELVNQNSLGSSTSEFSITSNEYLQTINMSLDDTTRTGLFTKLTNILLAEP